MSRTETSCSMDRIEQLRREAKELRERADHNEGSIARECRADADECRADADDLDALADEQESERLMHQANGHTVRVWQKANSVSVRKDS